MHRINTRNYHHFNQVFNADGTNVLNGGAVKGVLVDHKLLVLGVAVHRYVHNRATRLQRNHKVVLVVGELLSDQECAIALRVLLDSSCNTCNEFENDMN